MSILEFEKIEEKALEKQPEFLESLANNPVAEQVGARKNVYENLLRLESIEPEPLHIDVPAGTMMTPSLTTIRRDHKFKNEKPFVYLYSPYPQNITFANPKVYAGYWELNIVNFSVAQSYDFVVCYYKLLTKDQKYKFLDL